MDRKRGRRASFEDISSYTSNRAVRKNKKRKKKIGWTVVLSIIFALLILLGSGMIYAGAFVVQDLATTKIAQDEESLGITTEKERKEGITNIALFGVDSRLDQADDEAMIGRSDAIMVVSVDTVHNKIKLTSLLRDARVYLGDETPNEGGYDKLNHAYAYGGPEFAIRTLNQTYGLDIKDYVSVNLAGMADIIDAMGGVDVDVTEAEIEQINNNLAGLYYENPEVFDAESNYYNGPAGFVHLNGAQAVSYGRIRNIDTDAMRAGRQQEILSALLGKATSLTTMEYPSVITKMLPLVETSLSISDIVDLAGILVDGFSIEHLVIPGEVIPYETGIHEGGAWMWTYDMEWAKDYIHSFIYEVEMTYVPPVEEETEAPDDEADGENMESSTEEESVG